MALGFKMIPVSVIRHMSDDEIKSEQELVQKAMRDAEKFGVLYDKYFEIIFHFIFRRTEDEAVTADLTSQTFYIALENLKKYEFRGLPFSAWLYRIAGNEVNKYYKKRKSKRVYSLEENKVVEIIEEAGEEDSTEMLALISKALNELPTQIIEIMELRFFEEKSFREIAYILDISESSAKMRIYRTLEKLRQMINGGLK